MFSHCYLVPWFRLMAGLRLEYYQKKGTRVFCICFILSLLQCPPFRLSYQGLGEPLCFAAFGPFASTAFYLMQGSTRLFDLYIALDFSFCMAIILTSGGFDSEMNYLPLSDTILSASVLVGFTTALILFCSHFHQVFYFYNNKLCIPVFLVGCVS
jgi:1,4-dihydroxy-2-naphthoate octaprenyltransferase